MIALSALRDKARTEYPGVELQLDSGLVVTLRSVMDLEDAELQQFNQSQKRLADLDEAENLTALKTEIVNILSGVSTHKAETAEALDRESFGTLTMLFREYGSTATDAAKSQSDS